MNEKLV